MYFICLTSTGEYADRPNQLLLEDHIAKIAQNDKQALCGLYEQTHDAVYGFALSILKNIPDAEDVLQETYLRIYACAREYEPCGKPMAWIFTITRNLSLMKLRDSKKRADLSEEDWERYAVQNPDITSEDKIVLQSVLRLLSDEESQIVILHAVTGFKHREIAELLQLPLPTVLSKYHRAIQKLRKKMMEGG